MNKEDLELNKCGYPTDETLKFLEDCNNFKDPKDLLETGKKLVRRIPRTTVGWSGCEAISHSMKKNAFWGKLSIPH